MRYDEIHLISFAFNACNNGTLFAIMRQDEASKRLYCFYEVSVFSESIIVCVKCVSRRILTWRSLCYQTLRVSVEYDVSYLVFLLIEEI